MSEPTSRFHWPRDGVAIRIPPRRLAAPGVRCELISFSGRSAEAPRVQSWDRLAEGLARGTRVVLLVAAEDVAFTAADIPALSGLRLREALPNLVEEKTVGEVGSLHVALGQREGGGIGRTLAVVDRAWLAAIQVHAVRSGLRVAAIVPEALAIPLLPGRWSFGCVGGSIGERAWLRTGEQQAIPLPDDAASAAAVAAAWARQTARPTQLDAHSAGGDGAERGAALAASLGMPVALEHDDPFVAWLAGDGPGGGYGPPLSLLAFDAGTSPWSRWSRWRIAAALAVAIVAVQIIGNEWQWGRLREEANGLRRHAAALLTGTFPDTRVVLDAPLQMARGLAGLRASAGRSDPADFSAMIAASGRIFATLPTNAVHAADYDARVLRLRFAPGSVIQPDARDRFVAAAAQEGYVLSFDSAVNPAGEAQASLRVQTGST